MKTRLVHPTRHAYSLIELIVYLGVYAMLLGLALLCFYKCFDHHADLRRHSDDITRAVRAGEVWRQDVRTATAAIRLSEADLTLHIPHKEGEIAYRFRDATVYRRAKADSPWTILLPRVQASTMRDDARTKVKAWCWEVELKSRKPSARVRPVFTFLAPSPVVTTP